MKGSLSAAGAVALIVVLLSCAGFPEPESPGNSLVIGSLILDFPDGFFNEPPQGFDSNVKLSFLNKTKGTIFDLYTAQGGYFYFQTNGTDEYVFHDFGLVNMTIGDHRYSFSGIQVNMPVAAAADSLVYVGHMVFTYTLPEETGGRGTRTTYWNYKPAASCDWDKNALIDYIRQKQPESQWLNKNIIEYGKKQ